MDEQLNISDIGGIKSNFKKAVSVFSLLDQKHLGVEVPIQYLKLAKDDRGAWINLLADQYQRKEKPTLPPTKFGIAAKDVIHELIKRELGNLKGRV